VFKLHISDRAKQFLPQAILDEVNGVTALGDDSDAGSQKSTSIVKRKSNENGKGMRVKKPSTKARDI